MNNESKQTWDLLLIISDLDAFCIAENINTLKYNDNNMQLSNDMNDNYISVNYNGNHKDNELNISANNNNDINNAYDKNVVKFENVNDNISEINNIVY